MRPAPALALAALVASCAHRPPPAAPPAGGATAPAASRLAWDVPGHGRLLVEIPPGWTAVPGEPDPPLPATLRLEPPDGHLVLLLTPTFDPGQAPEAPASADAARFLVELARRKAAETALEDPLELRELGGGATGWWFAATDRELGPGGRAPEPDEYRCLAQGVAAAGGLLVPFTILDDGDGPQRAAALEVVRRVRHRPGGAEGRPPASERQAAPRALASVSYPGKAWAVVVDLPGFRVEPAQARADQRAVVLLAIQPETGVVASLVLSEAGTRRTAAACAEADWLRISGVSPDAAGRAPPAGPAPRATYQVRDLDGRLVDQLNVSAWWYRDGVCIHGHASKMGAAPGDRPALERVLATVGFDEPL